MMIIYENFEKLLGLTPLDGVMFAFTILVLVGILVFGLDDLFIDLVALVCQLKPRKLTPKNLAALHLTPQKRLAIMIANWHEDQILERMIHGNLGRIDYQNYEIFLGVYPNDPKTLLAAKKLSHSYMNVHVVINSQSGPSSKGQMLNQIVSHILAFELKHRVLFDILLLQDSEDIIHPLALKLINFKMETNDFVQTPVFCLPTSWKDLTRGTYIDEFAESHTRDLLVRNFLGGGVPSAGVGTAMSRLFVAEVLKIQNNLLLKEDTLTEDYHLGLLAHRLGYESEFVCCYRQKNGYRDFIATREYFPSSVGASVRQRTRWTLGIAIQGYLNLKWSSLSQVRGRLFENYFLWRDRRGLLNAPLLICSYILSLGYSAYYLLHGHWPSFIKNNQGLAILFGLSLFFMLNRLLQRVRIVYSVYGIEAVSMVLLRWVLANFINTWASFKALRQHLSSLRTGESPKWIKTEHELPEMFGVEAMNKEMEMEVDMIERRAEVI